MLKQDYDVEEEPIFPDDEMETIYLYAYTNDPEQPRVKLDRDLLIAYGSGIVTLLLLVGLSLAALLLPNPPPTRTLRVPLQVSTQHLTASVPLVPTGTRTIPATLARGTLTIYNGSSLVQSLPAGFLVSTQGGMEIATDQAVIIPANHPPADGVATVAAHALIAGSQGNLPAGRIDEQDGSDLTIENLTAFSGGQDARIEQYVTPQDQAHALAQAHAQLATRKAHGWQVQPCAESSSQAALTLTVTWTCQFLHYHVPPGLEVLSVQLDGSFVLVRVLVPPQAIRLPIVK